jgi:hypothetical protein
MKRLEPVQISRTTSFGKPCRLAQRHAEQHLHGQAGLYGGIAVVGLPAGAASQVMAGSTRSSARHAA